jgi:hypothetical protein
MKTFTNSVITGFKAIEDSAEYRVYFMAVNEGKLRRYSATLTNSAGVYFKPYISKIDDPDNAVKVDISIDDSDEYWSIVNILKSDSKKAIFLSEELEDRWLEILA